MTHSIDDLIQAIEFARITPDSQHFNAVDDMALAMFSTGALSAVQMRNASLLARKPLGNA